MKIKKFELTKYKGIKKFEVEDPPDLVVLVGPNGSGKSTVLKALNEILEYLFGYRNEVSNGIKITLDFSDEIDEILELITKVKPQYIQWLNNFIEAKNEYFEKVFHDIEIAIKSSLISKRKIVINNGIINIHSIKFKQNNNFDHYSKNNRYTNDKVKLVNHLLNLVFQTRSRGNANLPGIAILETEKENARNSILNMSNTTVVGNERISKLNDESWRKNTLSSRLISLILRYSRKQVSTEGSHLIINPVEKINQSLQTFIPHVSIISPIETDNKLMFNVRNQILSLDQLSSGEIAIILFAIDYLEMEIGNGVLIIDEPGSHLHHNLKKRIIPFIIELTSLSNEKRTEKPQIWISTHSPSIINSIDTESIFLLDIEKEGNIVSNWNISDDMKKTQLNLLGISQIFQTPMLFVEGSSDMDLLNKIFIKLNPKILINWQIDYIEGVENINQIIKIQDEFKEKTKNIAIIQQQLNQNHFLKDFDNNENSIRNDKTFIWDFYHLENLLFQEPWLTIIKRTMKYRGKPDNNQDDILKKAIKEIYEELKLDKTFDELIENNEWNKYLPGRDILKRWKKYNSSSLNIPDAFSLVLNESFNEDDFPNELIRLSNWLDVKYKDWLEK
ncbi:MAG TPA: AAA family ATPase [Candidatus Bathyarchaeia archaeon]|nr:AAA family ATPase [Candidatus Bathyarchaeia archaeon]